VPIYKDIPTSNINITPFESYAEVISTNVSPNNIIFYQASFDNYLYSISDDSDPNNSNLIVESDGRYGQTIYHSINHLFYLDFDKNYLLKFGEKYIQQYREIDEKINIFSIPRSILVEGIKPETIALSITDSGSGFICHVIDDEYGNLIDSDRQFVSEELYNDLLPNIRANYNFNEGFYYNNEIINGVIPNITLRNKVFSYNAEIKDKSKYHNHGTRYDMSFIRGTRGMYASFNGTSSYITIKDKANVLNFGIEQEYAISFFVNTSDDSTYLITKNGLNSIYQKEKITNADGKIETIYNINYEEINLSIYPYQISIDSSGYLNYSVSDGKTILTAISTTVINDNNWHHIICQKTTDSIQLIVDGILESTISSTNLIYSIKNDSLVVFGKLLTNYFDGALDEIKFYNRSLDADEYLSLATLEINNTFNYYVGNVFYDLGFIVLTSPYYYTLSDSFDYTLTFNSKKMIYEYEFLCQVERGELNNTTNPSTLLYHDQRSIVNPTFASSSFSPYISTIGLYNDENELLAVGKLSRPIQKSQTNDMTFVVKFDAG